MRASGDPKFQHLSEELHVEISAFATPAEAHARIAYALAEVRRFLVPVSHRIIKHIINYEKRQSNCIHALPSVVLNFN